MSFCLIFTIVFSGFLTNFLNLFSFNLSTLLIDLFIVVTIVVYLIFGKGLTRGLEFNIKEQPFKMYLVFLFLLIFKALFDENNLIERVLGFRNYAIYLSVVFLAPLYFRSHLRIERYIHFWITISFILCVFSIIQGIFFNYLPKILLTPKSDEIFSFYETNIVRVNGLIGNPINFSGFLLLFFALTSSSLIYTRKIKFLLFTLLCLIALYLTYSRISLIGALLILSVGVGLYLLKIKYSKIKLGIYLILALVGITIFSNVFFSREFEKNIMVQRMLGNEETTKGSNLEHILEIEMAIKYIKDYPILGVGIGSQGESGLGQKIITDGAWYQIVLELGAPVAVCFFLIIFYSLFHVYNLYIKSSDSFFLILTSSYITFSAFIILSGFINSLFLSKIIYIEYWLLLGIILGYNRISIIQRKILIEREQFR